MNPLQTTILAYVVITLLLWGSALRLILDARKLRRIAAARRQ